MNILDWLLGDDSREGDDVDEAVERLLALHPQLKLVRRCKTRLASAVETSQAYIEGLLAHMPTPHEANEAAWSTDPWIHAFFGSPDDVTRVISASPDLRQWFERNPDEQEVHAVLGMEMTERRVLGVEQHGDAVRRDVSQTALSFTDHQLRLCGRSGQDLRREVLRRLMDQLGLEALEQINADKSLRDRLAEERALLRTRLKLLELHGAGVMGMFNLTREEGLAQAEDVKRSIEDNQRALERCGTGEDALERELEKVRMVFASPEQYLSVWLRRFRLNAMNILVADLTAPGVDIEVPVARIPTSPPLDRAFTLVRFARRDLREQRELLKEAERLLV